MDAVKRLPLHSAFQAKKVTVGPDVGDGLVRLSLRDRNRCIDAYLTGPEAMELADHLTVLAEPLMEAA